MKDAINECMTPTEVVVWLYDKQVNARILTADAASAMARLRFLLDERNEAQHEATWAMAMEAVKSRYSVGAGGPWTFNQAFMDELKGSFPCPPLQTTNEKCEG